MSSPNRFDLLRLLFAGGVFIYHVVALSGLMPLSATEGQLGHLAELCIQGFFIVSGALVYGSWERSSGLADYAGKRFRRLYPAYFVIIVIPALIAVGLAVAEGNSLAGIARYLAANLSFLNFLEPALPGIFEANRFNEVNGALWTLKIEVMFYVALPLLALGLARLGRYWWVGIGLLIAGAFAWRGFVVHLETPYAAQLARQLPGQMMYFAAGMTLWRLWPLAKAQAPTFLGIGLVALALSYLPMLEALRVLGLAGLIAGLAFLPGPTLNAARWGDISYGLYITHFPIVQLLAALGTFTAFGLVGGLTISVVLVVMVSFALWWLVERPALRKDSHYRTVSKAKLT